MPLFHPAFPWLRIGSAVLSLAACQAAGLTLDPGHVDFFESKVRPLLADHCYECHSAQADKAKGGLRLDTRDDTLKGGAAGPALVPGNPDESLLVQAVKGTAKDLERMPPAKKGPALTAEQIAVLEEWVRLGAPDPRASDANASHAGKAAAHWAFQRPVSPPVPEVDRSRYPVNNPVDAFVSARLEELGILPAPAADRRTALRRVTFDLTGLPPTPAEMDDFLADGSPLAFERAVDRLLASPRYGERWARHWLDVARYADSKGYVFEEERRYPYAYTYRDWVVKAFNDDLPYDRFLVHQIAGDQCATPDDPSPMAAQGFLTLGRRFLNNQNDIIDDRIDVVFRGTMGLTVACARCHDHKFDPIPTADYYSLHGVFASSREPDEKPLLGPNPNAELAAQFAAERDRRRTELSDFQSAKVAEVAQKLRGQVGDYLLGWHDTRGLDDEARVKLLRSRSLPPHLANRWNGRFEAWQRQPDPVMAPFLAFHALGTNGFAEGAAGLVRSLESGTLGDLRLNPRVVAAFATNAPASMAEVAGRYTALFRAVDLEWQAALDGAKDSGGAAPTALPEPDAEALRQHLFGADSPTVISWDEAYQAAPTPDQQKFRALRRKVDELEATHPGAPLRAMALVDRETATEPVIFKRGNPGNRGPAVRRQFLSVVAGSGRKPFERGSGRLELAEAIASRENPLTARVLVNRIWAQHFGTPLVRTPSDFGVRSEPPTHPGLLDHLAVWFMDHGWSVKALHRYLLTSATYRRASDPGDGAAGQRAFAEGGEKDPGNTLYWRMNRKRNDFEALRDSLLAVSGRFDGMLGGQPVEMFEREASARRSIYGFIDRQNLPGVLRVFDFASPDSTSPMRFQTTVPQQALFMLNSPFMAARARDFLSRPEIVSADGTDERIIRLHELAYQRPPSRRELALGRQFVARPVLAEPVPEPAAAWSYGTGEVGPDGRVRGWRPLPKFVKDQWQWEDALPASTGQWTFLNAKGGHPGANAANAAIRRWTAPVSGVVKIEGSVEHPAEQGDGIRAKIVSSRLGEVGSWTARHGKLDAAVAELAVERGDTVDFVVEPQADENSDSFNWSPKVILLQSGSNLRWDARRDFGGRRDYPEPLDPWQQYAQVLLSANEFVFVD